MAVIRFKPNNKQKEALVNVLQKDTFKRVLFYGGSRSGKTFLFLFVIVLRALKYPGSRHIILRRTRRSIELSVWNETMPKVLSMFPGLGCQKNKADLSLRFQNGSEVFFDGLDDPGRVDSILGREYATIFFNEVSEQLWYVVEQILSRLAQKIEGLTTKAFFDCNPPGRGHWSWQLFFNHLNPSDRKTPMLNPNMYAVRQLNPGDNAENIAAGYIEETLASMSESRKKRFLYGEYGASDELTVFPVKPENYYSQQEFKDWVKAVHPENVRLTAGADFALDDADAFVIIAYATLAAKDPKRWVVYEYKQRRETTEAFAKAIKAGLDYVKQFCLPMSVDYIYCDHGKTCYDLYSIYGLPTVNANKADKQSGIELLHDEVVDGSFKIRQQGNIDNEFAQISWKTEADSGMPTREIDDGIYHPDLMDAILYAMRSVWYYETKKTI